MSYPSSTPGTTQEIHTAPGQRFAALQGMQLTVLLDALQGVELTASEQARALAAAVRDGELAPGQRERLAALLIDLDTAARLAPRVREYYPDCDAAAVGYLTGNWQQVITAYASLLATAHPGSGEHAA